ncbi:MAG: hypothetical protein Tsb0016_11610 [Sphingomonadales bacterium]
MRLKTITAASTQEAMKKVRDQLGPDAIIVNIDSNNKGAVRITAAVERLPQPEAMEELAPAPTPAAPAAPFDGATLAAMLRYHGIPSSLATRIQTAATAMDAEALDYGLAAGLETLYRFHPIAGAQSRSLLFVGPPGAGKTLSVAKLAADYVMEGRPVRLVTMDTVRAGGLEQLDHFARLMKLQVATAPSPDALRTLLAAQAAPEDAITLIDSVGANPYSLDDIQALARAVKLTGAEPVLVLPAGVDALEAAEMADIFASLGARRMIATRLDGARRYAGVLTALYKGGLALAAIGAGPFIADGLAAASALNLAQHIIAKPDPARIAQLKKKAVS